MKTTTLNKILPPEAINELQSFINMNPGIDKYSPDFKNQIVIILSKYHDTLKNQRVDIGFLAYSIINSLR